uniref:Uncharacterized protein n=1 Tax=Electrophorus electricus TaxID=8005 RepID=A0A4W4GNQ4_ELEEL
RLRPLKSAARLLLCRLSCSPSRLGGVLLCRTLAGAWLESGAVMPVHLLICFCRYLRWLTFLLDFTGLSKASLMLLEAELMKLSRSRLVCLTSPSPSTSPSSRLSRTFSAPNSITEPGNVLFWKKFSARSVSFNYRKQDWGTGFGGRLGNFRGQGQ